MAWQRDFAESGHFDAVAAAPGNELLLTSTAAVTRVDTAGRVRWRRAFGAWPSSHFERILPLFDGWILAGQNDRTLGDAGSDVLVARLAFDGTVRWTRTYGEPDSGDQLALVRSGSDGGFWFIGESWASTFEAGRLFVIRARAGGTERWRRTYPEIGFTGAGEVFPGPRTA